MSRLHRKGDRAIACVGKGSGRTGWPSASKTSPLPWINGGLILLLVSGGFGLPFLIKDGGSNWVTYDAAISIPSGGSRDVTTESSTEETVAEGNSTEETVEEGNSASEPGPEVGATTDPSSEGTEDAEPGGGSGDLPAAASPDGLGTDTALNDLARRCFDGDMTSCDDLFVESPFGSDYEAYGNTCGQRVPEADVDGRDCVIIF